MYINTVQDILDIAKKLESKDPGLKIVFVDSDYNSYNIANKFKATTIGEATTIERDLEDEDDDEDGLGDDINEECILFVVD